MKLMAADTNSKYISNISIEAYTEYFKHTDYIATEALADYLYKTIDFFNTLYAVITHQYKTEEAKEIFSYKNELLHKIKNINVTEALETFTEKPQNFKGKYIEYVEDLRKSFSILDPVLLESGELLKLAISDFINNADLDQVFTLHGQATIENNYKIFEKNVLPIKKYFPLNNGSSKTTFREILKTFNDIKPILEDVASLDKIVNSEKQQVIKNIYETISTLLDHLTEETNKGNINIKNDKLRKDLIFMVHTFSKMLELYGYMVFNLSDFYKTFVANIKDITRL